MTSRRSASRRFAGLLLAACACTAGETGGSGAERRPVGVDEHALVDADGRTVALDGPARRVVSLVPSATATIAALGRTDVLVGRTDFDTASWAAHVPSVGGGLQPSLEAVVALAPDLVIRFAGEQDTRTPARLDAIGIEHMAVRPDRVEDIYTTIDLVGRALGENARADSLEATIRAGLERASASVAGLPRVRVAYLLDGTPPWAAGPNTFIDEVLSLMGGDNVFADLGALYAPVSPEQLRGRAIDVVLLGGRQGLEQALVPGARIERAGGALDLPGPGVVDDAYRIGEILHARTLR